MLCQICNERPATVHITKVLNGTKVELHMCEECAREKEGIDLTAGIPQFETSFSLPNILSGMMDFVNAGVVQHTGQSQLRCKGCGMDYESFKKTGMLGCSQCYENFESRLEPLIKRIHGNAKHTGKVPKRTGGLVRVKRDIERLKYELNKAIENEEYEKAAELRDRIKALENNKGEQE